MPSETVLPLLDSSAPPFDSVADLRKHHADLMRAPRTTANQEGRREAMRTFLARAQMTGRRVGGLADRDAVQGILDYWTAALYELPHEATLTGGSVTLAPFDRASATDLADKPCPFMGLNAFGEADAGRFFGRAEAVKTLAEKVVRRPVVLITGPSGGGKSSLVLAGLLPRLKAGPPDGSGGWRYLPVIVPGTDPMAALLQMVCPAGTDAAAWVAQERGNLEADPDLFRRLLEADPNRRPALLVVDQFEELFTLCPDQRIREAYSAAVVGLAGGAGGGRVVLTLREDFEREAFQLPALKPLAADPDVRFSPPALSSRELHGVIERPAEMVGLLFDDGLTDELVKEVVGEPTALPLLQFTLMKLWENRDQNWITWEVYRKVGSPREALKRTADAVYDQLPQDLDRQVARLIFTELVQPSVGVEFVRRRVRRESLRRLASSVTVDDVLRRFTAAGLVRLTPGKDSDDDRFEVAHEALIRNWPRLAEWLQTVRNDSQERLRLRETARLWKESGRKEGYLLTGSALKEAAKYADSSPDIAELVQVSQGNQERWQRVQWYGLVGAVAVLLIGCVALLRLLLLLDAASERRAKAEAAEVAAARRIAYEADLNVLSLKAAQRFRTQLGFATQTIISPRERHRPLQPGLGIGGFSPGREALGPSNLIAQTLGSQGLFAGGPPAGALAQQAAALGIMDGFTLDLVAGTVAAMVFDKKTKKVYILTIPSALTSGRLYEGMPVFQPSLVDGGKQSRDQVARVSRWLPISYDAPNHATGVIAELLPNIEWNPKAYAFGEITGVGQATEKQAVQIVGRSSVLKSGRLVSVTTHVPVGFPSGRSADFQDLIMIKGESGRFSQPGDGGAPVFTPTGQLIGVVLAAGGGTEEGFYTYAIPISRILDELGVELITKGQPAK